MVNVRKSNAENVIERWDEVFRALSAEPRRQLVVSLLDSAPDESIPLPESAVNPNIPTDPNTLRMTLRHTHLPLLADMGLIDWQTEPLVASRGPRFEEVAKVIGLIQSSASEMPNSLVIGCRRLEQERQLQYNQE